MKKQTKLLVLLLTLAAILFCSCKQNPGVNIQTPADNVGNNYIFKPNANFYIVSSPSAFAKTEVDGIVLDNPDYIAKQGELVNKLNKAFLESGEAFNVGSMSDSSSVAMHEIIIGESSRPLAKKAYQELDKISTEDFSARFVIYSNGSSVAIAYERGDYEVAALAIEYFINNYVNGKSYLLLEAGLVHSDNIDLIAYHESKSEEESNSQWAALESDMLKQYKAYYGADKEAEAVKLAEETVNALRNFYSSFDADALVSWFANLYEPEICVCNAVDGKTVCQKTPYCGGAGFYFSNSGRNTLGFMPDIETTAQVFGFLKNSGMLNAVNKDVSAAFPEGEAEKIVKWVKSMQDAGDGYFYHPQWSKQETQANIARMSRDLSYGLVILNTFGAKPTYDTPSGASGEEDVLPTSSIKPSERLLTGRFASESTVTAASRVVAVAETETPSFLATEAAFRNYLSKLNIRYNSYLVCNEISSIADQIKQRDKVLAQESASYRLTDILMNWFAENQNPDTGTWDWGGHENDPYYANNGVLKAIAAYNTLGREFPNPIPAITNAIKALTCDTPINHVCDLYNTWFAVSFICDNLRKYGNSEEAKEVQWSLREQAPEAIAATTEKMAACRIRDGSYSYHPGVTQTTSQGLPVAAPTTTAVGDVNATIICTYGNIQYMFGALGFSGAPSICNEADRLIFKNKIAELGQVIKNSEVDPYTPDTFDNEPEGSLLNGKYTFVIGGSSESKLYSQKDVREGADGNVMHLHSGAGSWDTFTIGTKTGVGGDAYVFESDICFESMVDANGDTPNNYIMQLWLGGGSASSSNVFYGVTARAKDGSIYLYDMSSTNGGDPNSRYTELYSGLKFGEWIHIKIEFHRLDDYNTRAKIYVGETRERMKLVCISDNYYDFYASSVDNPDYIVPKIAAYTSNLIAVNTNYKVDILFDNLCTYRSRVAYEIDDLAIEKNVDGPVNEALKYDFTKLTAIPEKIEILPTDGTVGITENGLKLAGGSFELPANYVSNDANVASFSADILWSDGKSGETLLSLLFTEGETKVMSVLGLDFKVLEINEGGENVPYLVLYERQPDPTNTTSGAAVKAIKIAKNKSTNIRIDFYHDENMALLYVDGVFLGKTEAVYKETAPRTIDKLTVTSSKGEVFINNLVFERHKFDFATAVEPKDPPHVYEFDNKDGLTFTGGADISDGYALLSGANAVIKATLEERSPVVWAHSVKFQIIPDSTKVSVVRLAIEGKDKTIEGKKGIIIAVDVYVEQTSDGYSVKAYEVGAGGSYNLVVAQTLVGFSENVELALSWYPDKTAANVEVNGKAIGSTSVCYDAGAQKMTPTHGAVYGVSDGTVKLDDLIAESVPKKYVVTKLEGENEDDDKEKLEYEYSSATNLPKAFTATLAASGSSVRVEQALKVIKEQKNYSKALVIDSRTGDNDRFVFAPYSDETEGANRVFFDTEMMVSSDSSKSSVLFQVMLTNTSWLTRDVSYMFTIGRIGDEVILGDASSTNKEVGDGRYESENYIVLGKVDEWFRLVIEYYRGDKDSVKIVIRAYDSDGKIKSLEQVKIVTKKVNEQNVAELVGVTDDADKVVSSTAVVSDNYYGPRGEDLEVAPDNKINSVLFYGQTGNKGVVYFDNTTFGADSAGYNKEYYTGGLGLTLKDLEKELREPEP